MKKYNIGIDLGGTKALCAILNSTTHEVLFEVKKKTKKEKGNEKIASKLIEAINELFEVSKINKKDVNFISIATAGQIDFQNGIILEACNLECFNFEIKKIIEEQFSIKTYILNDVEASAIAELKLGSAKGYKNAVCMFIGTGIGSSIIIDGKIYKGAGGHAGEVGHTIINLNGKSCACGACGCLETYCSRTAIEKRIQGMIKKGKKSIITDFCSEQNMSTKHIKTALDAHDEIVSFCVNEAIEYLSGGIANIINFLNPELIILGGGLIEGLEDVYLETIRQAKLRALNISSESVIFKKAHFQDYSGVVGASLIEEYNNG